MTAFGKAWGVVKGLEEDRREKYLSEENLAGENLSEEILPEYK